MGSDLTFQKSGHFDVLTVFPRINNKLCFTCFLVKIMDPPKNSRVTALRTSIVDSPLRRRSGVHGGQQPDSAQRHLLVTFGDCYFLHCNLIGSLI